MNRPGTSDFRPDSSDPSGQVGALCWRMNRGHVQVLLITSRDTGRWIIPKGWPHTGKTAPESAFAEAWEEAGVEGAAQDEPIGLYSYDKVLKPGLVQPCIVTVFSLRVSRLRRRFPERRDRRRKWFDVTKASRKVAEPELRAMFAAIAEDSAVLTRPGGLAEV